MNESLLSVHRVIELILTKAAVSAKLSNPTLRIPYKDLMSSVGKTTDKEIDLVLKITMEWDESQEEETSIGE
jgi:hypothetical protein